jgi:hypothetical protein
MVNSMRPPEKFALGLRQKLGPGHETSFSWLQAQSFEPPSTWIVSPVIQRASSEARKATADVVHTERESPARIRLGEVRHVGLDNAQGDGIDANAARAMHESEVLHQRVDGPLRRGVRRKRADSGMGLERRKQDDAATAAEDRQELPSIVAALETPALATRISKRSPTMARTCLASLCGPSGAARSAATVLARPPALRISATTASASFAPRP